MNNIIEVKYAVGSNSIHVTEPKKATSGSSGYNWFAAEEKILLPRCVMPIMIEFKMEKFLVVILEKSILDQIF